MNPEFTTLEGEKPGIITALLRASYADLLAVDPRWERDQAEWEEYDRDVFACPESIGACLFLTRLDGRVAGFGSWDPRQRPAYGIVGHNCVLPEFRGMGLGKLQILEILRRFRLLDIQAARVITCDHPYFAPARRMYAACGFIETRRFPWVRDSKLELIEYEKEIGRASGVLGESD